MNVLKYEYSYYSYAGAEYGHPCLCIVVDKNIESNRDSDYTLMLKLDLLGKTTEILRLKSGYLIKKFPDPVEEKAERILNELIVSTNCQDAGHFIVLKDSYGVVK